MNIIPKIESLENLLNYNLIIPNYQRPYKWSEKNIITLLEDINETIIKSEEIKDFKYRIGTIILYKNEHNQYEIVDGQQRILSLILIRLSLQKRFTNNLLNKKIEDNESIINISKNYKIIDYWFSSMKKEEKQKFINAFNSILEVIVIIVNDISLAFQLFDSQNTRGLAPTPTDILKAYHLRKMEDDRYNMLEVTTKWEAFNPMDIKNLFGSYLFPILNWSRKEDNKTFTIDMIDEYKGISKYTKYNYGIRTIKASSSYQITEPFTSGSDFFEMTSHYLHMKKFLEEEIKNNYNYVYNIIENKEYKESKGFNYATNLFYCALLCFYDRFNILNNRIVDNLFKWAMMLRIDLQLLGQDSINRYALGEEGYTNKIPMFYKIITSRNHMDIINIPINFTNLESKKDINNLRKNLYNDLINLNKVEK